MYVKDINLLPGQRQKEELKGKGGGHCQISCNWTTIFILHRSITCSVLLDTGLMNLSTDSHDQWPPWFSQRKTGEQKTEGR